MWIRQSIKATSELANVRKTLSEFRLHTVCQEAHCPNRELCFGRGQATFLILGNTCTRSCGFCAVSKGVPQPIDPGEPKRVASATSILGLSHVVITSVTRDDLEDGGASAFAQTIKEIRKIDPNAKIEVLVPDFNGKRDAINLILDTKPDVFNHNIETVQRLYLKVRPQADYRRSLEILDFVAKSGSGVVTKSGFMVGLGETDEEVYELLKDLRDVGVQIVTIGQYLQPTPKHLFVDRFVEPEIFEKYSQWGKDLGIKKIFSGPLVRSSFMAEDVLEEVKN